jgi:hypothetical protein
VANGECGVRNVQIVAHKTLPFLYQIDPFFLVKFTTNGHESSGPAGYRIPDETGSCGFMPIREIRVIRGNKSSAEAFSKKELTSESVPDWPRDMMLEAMLVDGRAW